MFIGKGTYLLLEKVKALVYRNLFKKVYLVLNKRDKIKLDVFQSALSWMGVEMGLDEIECVLANLIFKSFIKGYLSHQHRTLVLSKKSDPFPVESVIGNDG